MNFREQLRHAHLKSTPNRLKLLETLSASDPLSIRQLHTLLRGDLSTLYRGVNTLCDKGLLQRIDVEGETHFQLNTHQHYIICKGCHKLEPLPLCPLQDELHDQLKKQSGFMMTEHKLELYGYCEECAKRHKKS